MNGAPLTEGAVERLRRGFAPSAEPFAVVLVGKDTGVKMRRREPVAAGELFSIIDAMPMRRREMRGSE